MTAEEKREQVIEGLTELMKVLPYTVEYKVKKKPQGIKVIIEVTKDWMDKLVKQLIEEREAASARYADEVRNNGL